MPWCSIAALRWPASCLPLAPVTSRPGSSRVGPGYVAETRGLIWALGVWWALGMLASPARCILIGQQRFGWLNLVMATGSLQLALIVVLFELGHVSLFAVGIAFAVTAVAESRRLSGPRPAVAAEPALGASPRGPPGAAPAVRLWRVEPAVQRRRAVPLVDRQHRIARLLGPSAVPHYALPFMLISLGRVVVGGLSTPLTPLAAAQARESRALALTLVRSTRIAVILTLASTGLLVVAAEDLFRLWIGPDYASGWLVYACLMASFWAVYAQMPASNILGAGDIRRPAAVVLAATAGAGRKDRGTGLAWPGRDRRGAGQRFLCPAGDGAVRAPLRLPAGAVSLARLYREAYLPPALLFVPVAALGWLLFARWTPANLLELIGAFGALVAGYLAAAFWTLDVAERAAVPGLVRQLRAIVRLTRVIQGNP